MRAVTTRTEENPVVGMCSRATPRRSASPSPLLTRKGAAVHFCVLAVLSLSASRIPACSAQCAQGTDFCSPPSFDITGLGAAQLSASSTIKAGDQYCEVNSGKVGCSMAADGQFSAANLASSTSAWQSDILASASSVVTVELRLPVHYILFSIKVGLSRVPARLQVETSQDDGVSWRTRFRYTTNNSECEQLPLDEKALCDRYRGSPSEIFLYNHQDFLAMLGNTSSVAAHLNSRASPYANRVRLVFSQVDDNFLITEGGGNRQLLLYYRADQLEVSGTCWCNGHAEACASTGECECMDNTGGQHCEKCNDGYYRRNIAGGFACHACNCDMSAGAVRTNCSSLGMCECRAGYSGAHCGTCNSGYHRVAGQCVACACGAGAVGSECEDDSGRCLCRPGAAGAKCQRCHDDHYGLDENGCRTCDCMTTGSGGRTSCDMTSGQCECVAGVAGRRCDRCADGYERMTSSACTPVSTEFSMATESSAPSSGIPEATGTSDGAATQTSNSGPSTSDPGAQPVGDEGDSDGSGDLILIYAFIPATIAFGALVIVVVYVCRRKQRRHLASPDRESYLKRGDSCSSRVPLDAYAAHGPRSSPDDGRVGIGNRKMSMSSLYDTADVVAPQLRVGTPMSAPGSKRQSFISEEAMAGSTIAAVPGASILQEQLMPHVKESIGGDSLTAYDISKIANPPPEPYAESKFKMTNVGPRAGAGARERSSPSPSPEEPRGRAPKKAEPYASAPLKLTPVRPQDAEPLSRPGCEYTLPDPNLKRQRRSLKRQKSGAPSDLATAAAIAEAPRGPTSVRQPTVQAWLGSSSLASDV